MAQDWSAEWPPERIAEVTQALAAYVPIESVHVARLGGHDSIEPRTIIEVDGVFLVEAVGELDDWSMGSRDSTGQIVCWGRYGDIETALRSL
jgi:hypothetical protein